MKYVNYIAVVTVFSSVFGNLSPEVRQYCQENNVQPTCKQRAARFHSEQENPRRHILSSVTVATVTATASMI